MGAWPPYCLSSPKGQKEYWGFFFPVMHLAVFVVITRLKTSCQLNEAHVFEEATFQKF